MTCPKLPGEEAAALARTPRYSDAKAVASLVA